MQYDVSPLVAKRLEQDVNAKCSFIVNGADGKPLRVIDVVTLHKGEYVKQLTTQPSTK